MGCEDPISDYCASAKHGTGRLPRSRLVARILGTELPICLLDAPAGTGKSIVLDELSRRTGQPVIRTESLGPLEPGLTLWDPPHEGPIGPLPGEPPLGAWLILAKRPEVPVQGLARAKIYGKVAVFEAMDLLLDATDIAEGLGIGPEAAAKVLKRTGGWACLLPAAAAWVDDATFGEFLQAELLAPLAGPQLVAFSALIEGSELVAPGARLLAGLPFIDPLRPSALHPVIEALREPLRQALTRETEARMTSLPAVRAIAVAQAALGNPPGAIAALQSVGAWEAALQTLRNARGPFFVHRFGAAAFDRMLAGFPRELVRKEEVLVLCRALQAAKRGEIPLTRRLMADRWGPDAADARGMLADRDRYSFEARFFRFLICTWEDVDLPQGYLQAAHELLAEIPAEDDLYRGSFYNAVLEFYIRSRRFAEADHAAARAAAHYARAGTPILSFYVDLHRGLIQLFLGDPGTARRFSRAAAGHLARTPYDSSGDARLLALLDACIDFEQGDNRALVRFLSLDLDELARGEVWPSLIELVLTYGAQALAEQYSTLAARSFLDRWRATGEPSSQFEALIDIREMAMLQNANRWLESAALAARRPARLTAQKIESAPGVLATLQDRDEIGSALLALRQAVHEGPRRPGLEPALQVLIDNPHLTGRQLAAAELMRAQALRRQGRMAEALAQLRLTLARAAQMGSVAFLRDERWVLDDLLSVRRLAEPLSGTEPIRRLIRRVQGHGVAGSGRARELGLTRQETRILHLLFEGATNKSIAKAMGLSGATVKFHLANLYRKLGCSTRREAVAAAAALGLVS